VNRLLRIPGLCIIAAASFGISATRLAAQDAFSGDFSKRPAIEKRLAAVRAETAALPADADPEFCERLQELEAVCQFHLTALDVLATAEAGRDAAAKALSAWRGFTQAPPYPVLLQDEIRETQVTLVAAERSGEAQLRIFRAEIEGARDRLDAHQQAERQFREEAGIAATPEARQSAERSVKTEQVSSRFAAELVARINLRIEAQQAELDMIRSQIELAALKEKAIEGKTSFPKKDLDELQQAISRERAEALAALVAASRKSAAPNPLLSWRIEFLDLKRDFWNTRFAAFGKTDSAVVKTSLATLAEQKTRVDDWIEIARLRLSGGVNTAVEIDPEKIRGNLQQAEQFQRRIGFAIADLEGGHLKTPLLDLIASRLSSLWNAELYFAEETEVVNGSKITTYRAVTVAKLARLAFILTVGWLLMRFISRKVESLIVRKTRISKSAAELVAKSVFTLGLALLLVYGLNTVRIPFTVFAFLGGALAIGVGFGTQTMLKNFISGVILIFERPFKVGDTVEVEGVTGSIRSIGMRASIITQGNGIDTIIPNSNLLENQVTNWTLNDTLLRHSLTVGVDYSSPTREVSHALLAVVEEHGLVLKDPAPEVRFEDFGDKALVFRLLFWFDTRKITRDTLTSDLRYMIAKSFGEAGLIISSPQQDFKIHPESSLCIELKKPKQT
jgi:small-conductance mechanosensitive channel